MSTNQKKYQYKIAYILQILLSWEETQEGTNTHTISKIVVHQFTDYNQNKLCTIYNIRKESITITYYTLVFNGFESDLTNDKVLGFE